MDQIHHSGNFHLLFDELKIAVLLIGLKDGIIRLVNPCVSKDLGKTRSEIEGSHYRQIFWPEFTPVYDRLVAQCEDGKEHSTIYYWAEMALWEEISAHVIMWNSTPCVLMSITKISEIMRSEYKFESMAYFDNLLKLPNGAKLEKDLNDLADIEAIVLIYFKIERFEEINDLYGWGNGDVLLLQVRDWLLSSESRRAQLYRIKGGFVIFGRKVSVEDAGERAGEILQRFNKPWVLSAGGNSLSLHCIIKLGIVHGKYVKNEMQNILFRTIRTARNIDSSYVIYDEQADLTTKHSLMVRDALVSCIFDNMRGFDIHLQPIVDVQSRQWIGLEALCRWKTPAGDAVLPVEFIPVAEQLGLIGQLDSWVLETAIHQCISMGLDKKDFFLNVNLSPIQKIDDALIDNLLQILRKTGFPAEKLSLEITESANTMFDEDKLYGLRRLAEHGIILSLDDFGTGYSSLATLIKIPAKVLKMEKMFVDGIKYDDYRQYLLRMIVDIAHYRNMYLVVEGVETEQQFELLKQYGVDRAQGFLFSKPFSCDQLRRELGRFD